MNFTAAATSAICEAVGAGRCFYIDAISGSDTNDGSFGEPWKSIRNVVSYYGTPGANGSTRNRADLISSGEILRCLLGVPEAGMQE